MRTRTTTQHYCYVVKTLVILGGWLYTHVMRFLCFLSPVASSFSQAEIVFSVPGQFKVTPTSHHNFIMTENFICMIEVCGKYAFGSRTRAEFLLSKMAQININLSKRVR